MDESGIVYVGAEVRAGDILVGKVTPKSETSSSPEEIGKIYFGEKATDVRTHHSNYPQEVQGSNRCKSFQSTWY